MLSDAHPSKTRDTDLIVGGLGRWLIFLAGLAMLVSALILPARRDLIETRVERDRALHDQQYQQTRIDRYQSFLADLEHPTQGTLDLLALAQLGLVADGNEAFGINQLVVDLGSKGHQASDPLVFAQIDPELTPFVPNRPPISRLETLATTREYGFWFVLLGAVAVMYGLLPPAKTTPRVSTLPA